MKHRADKLPKAGLPRVPQGMKMRRVTPISVTLDNKTWIPTSYCGDGSRVLAFLPLSVILDVSNRGSRVFFFSLRSECPWIPAFAGMTEKEIEDPEFLFQAGPH